jgi:hypothetical protein
MGNNFYPSLTPTYGLGSYSRTQAAILCGNPRTRIGSQNRIYSWYHKKGLGDAYKARLLLSLGPAPVNYRR